MASKPANFTAAPQANAEISRRNMFSRADLIAMIHNLFVLENAEYRINLNTPTDYEKLRALCNRYLTEIDQIGIEEMIYCHRGMDDLLSFLLLNIIGLDLHNRPTDVVDTLILGEIEPSIAPFSNFLLKQFVPMHKKLINHREKNATYTFQSGMTTEINKAFLDDVNDLLHFIKSQFSSVLPPQ